jgi:hypothetical protein
MITPQSEKDYFTMPFIVSDKSLHTSGAGSKEFNLLDENEKSLAVNGCNYKQRFFPRRTHSYNKTIT